MEIHDKYIQLDNGFVWSRGRKTVAMPALFSVCSFEHAISGSTGTVLATVPWCLRNGGKYGKVLKWTFFGFQPKCEVYVAICNMIWKKTSIFVEEILNNHLGCLKHHEYWDIYYINWWVYRISEPSTESLLLGGGFKYLLFSPLFGEDSHFDEYFSNGLKPPTRLDSVSDLPSFRPGRSVAAFPSGATKDVTTSGTRSLPWARSLSVSTWELRDADLGDGYPQKKSS